MIVIGLLSTGCGSEKQLATVNNEPVTMDEFYQYLMTKRNVRVVVQGQVVEVPVAETLGFQALQELTTQRVLLQMAADAGLAPTEEDIEAEIKFKQAINPNYLQNMQSLGYTMGLIRREVAYLIAEERLLTRGISVEMSEVEEMMVTSPERFIQPGTTTVYQILVYGEDRKAQVDTELASAQGFKAVATNYNQSPDGTRVSFQTAALVEPLKSLLNATSVGSTTDWVAASGGFKKFYVESRTEDTPIEMTPERKETIRRQIALSYGRQANDLTKEIADKLRSASVEVSSDEAILKDLWSRFEETLAKSNEASTTAIPQPSE